MKRAGIVSVLALCAMTIGFAQENHGVEISVSSGIVFPAAPMTFADYWNMQYGAGVRAGIPLSQSFTLLGSIEHYRFAMSENRVKEGFDADHLRTIWLFDQVTLDPVAEASSVTSVAANVRVVPSGLSGFLSPYFLGGVGVMHFSLGEIKLQPTSVLSVNGSYITMTAQQTVTGGSSTSLFFEFGIGADIRMSESADLFVEARYASGLDRTRAAAYVPLNAGVRIRW